ncbi:MAG: endo alpha-1,4 polygalactosaminidase [Planctomycetes bacterium]|nr:endo alpha-1,4 polygalactosaminidase [Planctomycetota bacterium]
MPACAVERSGPAPAELDIRVLAPVDSWAIQLQGLDPVSSPTTLARRAVDMLVIEPMRSQHGEGGFPMRDMVRRLQASPGSSLPGKRVIAYLNVGQAEDYRTYWRPDWQPPTASGPGEPGFLLGLDPDGWQGNYPTAYWDPAWQRCLFGSDDAPLDQILADGFDGIYVDWVLGFSDPQVRATAAAAGVDPAAEMVKLLTELRRYARRRYPLFVVIAQNALPLAEQQPELLPVIDALAQEDLSFRGLATASWSDDAAGDIAADPDGENSTARLGARLATMRRLGLPVFTLDYALQPTNVERSIAASRSFDCVPCVSRTPLDRLPE